MGSGGRRQKIAVSNCGRTDFDFASYDYYAKHQRMMPEDWKEKMGGHDAIFFGAVGWPGEDSGPRLLVGLAHTIPAANSTSTSILRPVRLMPGVPSPLANRKAGDIDFWVVRENTEGEYSAIGGPHFRRHRARGGRAGNRASRASASTAC